MIPLPEPPRTPEDIELPKEDEQEIVQRFLERSTNRTVIEAREHLLVAVKLAHGDEIADEILKRKTVIHAAQHAAYKASQRHYDAALRRAEDRQAIVRRMLLNIESAHAQSALYNERRDWYDRLVELKTRFFR